jgi:CheY-like chemotaxis protein/nitrogen-specific signal transduction histidine kinase
VSELEPASTPEAKHLVLIVDDTRDVRLLCRKVLERGGYATAEAGDGLSCIAKARELNPACILLDVQMPEIDGYEVCRRLKALPETRDIPVLFLTATADDPSAVVTGLKAGGNDYIGKPVHREVLLARMSVALRLRDAELRERRARESAEEALQHLQRARADLALAHKMTGLAVLAAGLAHEVNSPLSALTTNIQFTRTELPNLGDDDELLSDCQEALGEAAECCMRISAIVDRMRQLGDSARARSATTLDVVSQLKSIAAKQQAKHGGTIEVVGAPTATLVGVEAELAEGFANIIENAFVAATSADKAKAHVQVDVAVVDSHVRVRVNDTGAGIRPDDLPFIFDPFFTRKQSWRSVGLGLGVALSIFTRHGGTLRVLAKGPLGGAEGIIEIPLDGVAASRPSAHEAPEIPTLG